MNLKQCQFNSKKLRFNLNKELENEKKCRNSQEMKKKIDICNGPKFNKTKFMKALVNEKEQYEVLHGHVTVELGSRVKSEQCNGELFCRSFR